MNAYVYLSPLSFIPLLVLCGLTLAANNGSSMPAYLLKLQQLRKAATKIDESSTEGHPRPSDDHRNKKVGDKKKPNRYKCVLMDEEDELLIDGAKAPDGSFIKVIPQHSGSSTKILHSPSFASEVQQEISAKESLQVGNEEDEYVYLTSTTSIPTHSPITIKRLNSTGTRTLSMSEPHDMIDESGVGANIGGDAQLTNATQNTASRQVRLPVAQGIPLKLPASTSSSRASSKAPSENLRHVGTPVSTPPSSNSQQQHRKRFMGSSSNHLQQSNNVQQLTLNDEHCQMIMQYASLYNVKDVKGWVHHNCAFAKMYLPNATCAEIDILVASCFR